MQPTGRNDFVRSERARPPAYFVCGLHPRMDRSPPGGLGCEKPEAFAGIAASGLEAGAPIEIRGHDMVAN